MIAFVVRVVRSPRVIIWCNNAAPREVKAVHNHEPAHRRDLGVGIKRDRLLRVKSQFGDFVSADKYFIGLARDGFERRSVDDFFDRFDTAFGFLGRQLDFVSAPFGKRLLAEPKEPRLETGELEWRRAF